MSQDKLESTRPFLILGNVALALWTILATVAVWFYNQTFSYMFLIFAAASIYLILRRLGCNSCAYCTSCTMGFGRLAGAFFGTGHTKTLGVGTRMGIIGFIYFFMAPLPAALLAVSMAQEFTILKVAVLAGLLAITAYSLFTWRKTKN